MDFCTFENREEDFVALKLLVISAEHHAPTARIHIPALRLPIELLDWLEARRNVVLHRDFWPEGTSWNIKPSILNELLSGGVRRVTWIDSDIIFSGNPAHLFDEVAPDHLILAEEGYRRLNVGTLIRTEGLGLLAGVERGATVNSCFLSVTGEHVPLLRRWAELLGSPEYREAQGMHWKDRPFYLFGDQDVLGGILSSSDFSDVPLRYLRSGRDVIHCMLQCDYTLFDRISGSLGRPPALVHAQALKLWRFPPDDPRLRTLQIALNPYRLAVKRYVAELEENERDALSIESRASRFMQVIFPHSIAAASLPNGVRGSFHRTGSRVKGLAASVAHVASQIGRRPGR